MIKSSAIFLSSDGRQHGTIDEVAAYERRSKVAAILLLRRASLPAALDSVNFQDIAEAIVATHTETRKVFDQITEEINQVTAEANPVHGKLHSESSHAAKPVAEKVPNRFFKSGEIPSPTGVGSMPINSKASNAFRAGSDVLITDDDLAAALADLDDPEFAQ